MARHGGKYFRTTFFSVFQMRKHLPQSVTLLDFHSGRVSEPSQSVEEVDMVANMEVDMVANMEVDTISQF